MQQMKTRMVFLNKLKDKNLRVAKKGPWCTWKSQLRMANTETYLVKLLKTFLKSIEHPGKITKSFIRGKIVIGLGEQAAK